MDRSFCPDENSLGKLEIQIMMTAAIAASLFFFRPFNHNCELAMDIYMLSVVVGLSLRRTANAFYHNLEPPWPRSLRKASVNLQAHHKQSIVFSSLALIHPLSTSGFRGLTCTLKGLG